MKTERTNTCGNCKAWMEIGSAKEGDIHLGACALHPPVITENQPADTARTPYPCTSAGSWCLDHVAMDDTEK